jgi:proteic killer suppression protein
VIKSDRDKRTRAVHRGQRAKSIAADVAHRARMRMERIDAAEELGDLRVPPSHCLEKLSGDRAGQWSIRVNDQWRICFAWEDGHAYGVELVDYH